MPDIDVDLSRQELHKLVDHIPEPEVASARDYLRSHLDPVELALLNAPADDEPLSEHERTAWEADELRRRRGESPISAEEVLRALHTYRFGPGNILIAEKQSYNPLGKGCFTGHP
jgi:hypothetical protein